MFLWKGQQQTNLKIYYNKETFANEHFFSNKATNEMVFIKHLGYRNIRPPTIRVTTGYKTFTKRIKKVILQR